MEREVLKGLLKRMLTIRLFELKTADVFSQARTPGGGHAYVGQEAVAAGVCAHLRPDDYITSTHRGHGHCIAKGGDLKKMMAELFGRRTGYCKGKGGSMHIADVELGILGANGIVGGGMPIAVGAALSAQYRGTDQVVVCFFGDGASNTATFHESLNLASIWDLPVIFVCENNLYAVSTSQREHQRIQDISDRAGGYAIPGVSLDGNDVIAVYETVGEAVGRARAGSGPTLLECKTYRWRGHFEGDPQPYRSKEELEAWMKRCPIDRLKGRLLKQRLLMEGEVETMVGEIERELEEAVRFAEESPFPEPQEAMEDLYA
ncbi:MAG: thiamine pyrophosphate-dependent dehydrogenase E1 component subunit alpha [Candidatus Tectomicrobia bacterium]|uniref:Thiamine pyrophosphate-dependent dehydrogenase E1 component subunit alpha n=1 Tax=Tectimicrobiota bacterium TaxID=2528274 RepID=A0A932CRA2_UNCTE|nr:thiamine pyrophosphate-dependent dehydrogenase E1 component subunit alpha [Candidatus Tectomicrobia bacterium]